MLHAGPSLSSHDCVLFHRLGRVGLLMLILHVSAPIVFSREGLSTTLFRVSASSHCAVVFACFVVLVVDVPVEMCFCAEPLVTLRALVRPFVVAFVVTELQ
jgi:hypothetical protein